MMRLTQSIDIQGIISTPYGRAAIINGEVHKAGDDVLGAKIKKITKTTVIFDYRGRTFYKKVISSDGTLAAREFEMAQEALKAVKMLGTTNRMFRLDNGVYTAGVLPDSCEGACPTSENAVDADACALIQCKYLGEQKWSTLGYVFEAVEGDGISSPCGGCNEGHIVACTRRDGSAKPPFIHWGYSVDRNGDLSSCGGAPLPVLSPEEEVKKIYSECYRLTKGDQDGKCKTVQNPIWRKINVSAASGAGGWGMAVINGVQFQTGQMVLGVTIKGVSDQRVEFEFEGLRFYKIPENVKTARRSKQLIVSDTMPKRPLNPLDAHITVRITSGSLTSYFDRISAQANVHFNVIKEGLEDCMITAYLQDITVREVLQLLLEVQGLTYQRLGRSNEYTIHAGWNRAACPTVPPERPAKGFCRAIKGTPIAVACEDGPAYSFADIVSSQTKTNLIVVNGAQDYSVTTRLEGAEIQQAMDVLREDCMLTVRELGEGWAFAISSQKPPDSQDTLRRNWKKMIDEGKRWSADAQPVWVTASSNVDMKGSPMCVKRNPITGWTVIFYSSSITRYFHASICQGEMATKEVGRDFATPPESLPNDFIDTDQVAKVVGEIANEWQLEACHFNPTLRMVGAEPMVDVGFPDKSAVWALSVNCAGDVGGSIFLEGSSGRVLKKVKHPTKGE